MQLLLRYWGGSVPWSATAIENFDTCSSCDQDINCAANCTCGVTHKGLIVIIILHIQPHHWKMWAATTALLIAVTVATIATCNGQQNVNVVPAMREINVVQGMFCGEGFRYVNNMKLNMNRAINERNSDSRLPMHAIRDQWCHVAAVIYYIAWIQIQAQILFIHIQGLIVQPLSYTYTRDL